MADYKEKIRNLLALAESSNEYEAKAALLKARELMAKHKISEKELGPAEEQNVERNTTGITWSRRRDPWIHDLACVISEHHCCKNIQYRPKGKQIAEVGFIGLTDDITVCTEVFKYAVECVQAKTKKIKKERDVRAANGYGFGFAAGLKDAYRKQQTEENWALVLVIPEAVKKEMSKIKKTTTKSKPYSVTARAFSQGMADGHKFHEQKRVKADDQNKTTSLKG